MKNIIGIDVGATKVEGIVVDEKAKIIKKVRVSTDAHKGQEWVVKNFLAVIKQLWIEPIVGVGVGVPGPVTEDGTITYMANIKQFENVNLAKLLSKELKIKVKVANDANLFALAEHIYGAGKKFPNMMGVVIGTGIGSGIILNNVLFSGRHGGAGEIGHNIVDIKNLKDLEYFCGGPGIVRAYIKAGGKAKVKSAEDVFAVNDKISIAVIEKVHVLLAQAFAQAVNLLNVELIVVGGGVSNALDYKKLNALTKKFVFLPLQKTFRVQKHSLFDSAGSLGAVSLFL